MSLIVDCDPALGLPMSDVDDALALWALRALGIEIDAITSVFGNSSLPRVHAVATDLGARWSIPVFRGAARPGDIDTPAVERLLAHRGDVLAIGPQTNIAAALARGASWSRLVLLGGTNRRLLNFRPVHTTELNFALDEVAASRALSACTDLVPMEPCRELLFRREHFRVLPPWMESLCLGWLRLGPVLTGRMGVVPWDVVAALYCAGADGFSTDCRGVTLDSAPLRRGYVRYGPGTVRVLSRVDPVAFDGAWAALRDPSR